MAISKREFAAGAEKLRPQLALAARLLLRCSVEDAEDVVSEGILMALGRLDTFDAATGQEGLRCWLTTLLYNAGRFRARREARHIPTATLLEAEQTPAVEVNAEATTFEEALRALPSDQAAMVRDWLEGYTYAEIARRLCVHRNTVPARLEEAFARLRAHFPDVESLRFALDPFTACARVPIYRKPRPRETRS